MKIQNEAIRIKTKGNPDLIDLTSRVQGILDAAKLNKGLLTVFVVGSTAAITTFEFEPGLSRDIRELFEKNSPGGKELSS